MIFGSRKKKADAKQETTEPTAPAPPPPLANPPIAADRTENDAVTHKDANGSAAPQPAPVPAPKVADRMESIAVAQPDTIEPDEQQPDPETIARIEEIRSRAHETFGKIVLAAMSEARYRSLSISDLSALFLNPLMQERIAIASQFKDGSPAADTPSGIAIWASVSTEVDAKIREQVRAGTFPVRLKLEEWKSGDINWLLDVIAPSLDLTTAVVTNFHQVVKENEIRIHPIVARMIDPETLEKMNAKSINADAPT